jgi:TyrR family helix-turn-helix protein
MGTQIEISETELRRLYEQEELSQREIAKKLGCSKTTIADRMREYGIQPRPPHVQPRFDITEDDLRRLYQEEKLSQEQIAAIYGCSQALVWLKMCEYGIPSRSHADAGILASGYSQLRHDFDRDQVARAYYIGFYRGDIHARMRHKGSQTIEVSCGSSKRAQIELFKTLFAPYGHIWQREPDKRGRVWMIAFLNLSFNFLLDLQDMIPDWILADPEVFRAFLAGYTDAEGSIWISKGYAAFALCSCDKNILHQIHSALLELGVECPSPRIHYPKGYTNKYGIRYSKDYWELKTGAKRALLRLFDLLEPYLKHAKRRQDMMKARANIEERNRKFGNRGM